MPSVVGAESESECLRNRDVVKVLGIDVDRLDMEDTLARIDDFIESDTPHRHVVVNASKLVMIQGDERLAGAVQSCDLVNADGQSVVWASRLTGTPLPCRVTGIDLMTELLRRSCVKGYRVYFLGAREETVARLVVRCEGEFSGLKIAGWHSGYFDAAEEQQLISDIRAVRPHILFVAMGSPLQEFWLYENCQDLGVPFCMGVGGTFDVLAGNLRRAPLWMQANGLEWLFRLLQEPTRMWRRYLKTNVVFSWLVWRDLVRRR